MKRQAGLLKLLEPDKHGTWMTDVFGRRPEYHPHVAGRGELAAVAELDRAEYGTYTVDHATLASWWKRYKRGIYVLKKGSEVIGAVGIWPITETAFTALASGRLDERELSAADICEEAIAIASRHPYWYLGDAILSPQYRRRGTLTGRLLLMLVRKVLHDWRESRGFAPTMELCALGFARGRPLLERFGLTQHATSPDGVPVYVRSLTEHDLEEIVDSLDSTHTNLSRQLRGWDLVRTGLAGAWMLTSEHWVLFTAPSLAWIDNHPSKLGLLGCGAVLGVATGLAIAIPRWRIFLLQTIAVGVLLVVLQIAGR